jgi:thiol-disulfide isomerase/thioredoxin
VAPSKQTKERLEGTPITKGLLAFALLGVVAGSCLASAASNLPSLKAERWVNSPPLTPQTLRGKVVLVDFWEFTCVNWIRTAPYVKAWNRDYASLGLVVIGVHAPEFEFGRRAENIDRGIRDRGLAYPIAIDNDFAIWRAFGNDAWPAKYLFDDRGRLVRRWVGEGSYDEIEREIRRLLLGAQPGITMPPVSDESSTFAKTGQPSYAGITNETYIGADRREPGAVTLKGDWHIDHQYVELRKGNGEIDLPFTAAEVNLVMQPGPSGRAAVSLLLDGHPVGEARGMDVGTDGVARFDRSGMIRLVAGAPRRRHVLTLSSGDAGLRAYVFTFGP